MKIPGDLPKISGIYGAQKNAGRVSRTEAASAKKDVLQISNEAKDFQTVSKALKDVPDIRRSKVEELTDKIESGGYDVKGRDVADKIIRSAFDQKA